VRIEKQNNLSNGDNIGIKELQMCMLQLFDDTLFVREQSIQSVLAPKSILRCFELSFGLKVNFAKTNIRGI